jgi:predicted phosphodiesterase
MALRGPEIVRIAALYDVHGNLPALEAVVQEIRQLEIDQVVVGGDVVPGPMQNEALQCLLDLPFPVQFIQENCEVAVLAAAAGREIGRMPEQAKQAVRWSAQQFQPEALEGLASWPKTLRIQVPGLGPVLFCHGTPRDENEYFTRLTPEDHLLQIFAGTDASVIVCGHTHMQFDRMVGNIRVVNAGSVGMPFGPPGAYWLLIGPDIELRRTSYDLQKAAEQVLETNFPQAQEFAERAILQPPSEEQMLEVLTSVQAKQSRR